jgi:hypothetical protein
MVFVCEPVFGGERGPGVGGVGCGAFGVAGDGDFLWVVVGGVVGLEGLWEPCFAVAGFGAGEWGFGCFV